MHVYHANSSALGDETLHRYRGDLDGIIKKAWAEPILSACPRSTSMALTRTRKTANTNIQDGSMQYYHYTNGHKLEPIRKAARLLPAVVGIERTEKPIVWFSSHPYWEPTATKPIQNGKSFRLPDLEELDGLVGLYRFVFTGNPEQLHSLGILQIRANIRSKTLKGLKQVGLGFGANPEQWSGSLRPVPLEDLRLEKLFELREWRPISFEDGIRAFKDIEAAAHTSAAPDVAIAGTD